MIASPSISVYLAWAYEPLFLWFSGLIGFGFILWIINQANIYRSNKKDKDFHETFLKFRLSDKGNGVALIEEIKFVVDEWKDELQIENKIIELSKTFINKLPHGINLPSISVENQKALLFEWAKEIDTNQFGVLSVIIEEDRIIYSTYNLNVGGSESNGVINMSDLSIEFISHIILEHFKAEIGHVSRIGHTI